MAGSKMVSRINSILAEKGISKQEFYDACGITSASYSLWNTGKTKPRMKNIETIAKFLQVPVSHLLEDAEEKEKSPAPEGAELSKERIQMLLDQMSAPDLVELMGEIADTLKRRGAE